MSSRATHRTHRNAKLLLLLLSALLVVLLFASPLQVALVRVFVRRRKPRGRRSRAPSSCSKDLPTEKVKQIAERVTAPESVNTK